MKINVRQMAKSKNLRLTVGHIDTKNISDPLTLKAAATLQANERLDPNKDSQLRGAFAIAIVEKLIHGIK